MSKHLIEDLKVGVSGGGMACGPVPGCVNVEMQLRDTGDNSVMFYGMTDVEGVAVYLKSEESLYDILMANDYSDEDGWNKAYAADIGEHDDDNDPIWRLLRYFLYADWDAVEELKPKCIGKYLEDIDIPKLDDEDDDDEEIEILELEDEDDDDTEEGTDELFERKFLEDGSVEVTVGVSETVNEVLEELAEEYNLPAETILSVVTAYNLKLFKKKRDKGEA